MARDRYPFWKGHIEFHYPSSAEVWYKAEGQDCYVSLVNEPGTLAYSILACKADIPIYGKHIQVVGDKVEPLLSSPPRPPSPEEPEDDSEDCSDLFKSLPIIQVDEKLHFTKRPSYKSEIDALLKCQGSQRIVQLLGQSSSGDLVFPKLKGSLMMAAIRHPVKGRRARIKKWLLEIIEAVIELHALGIIHRDLVLRNVLEAEPLVVCDLQCRYSTYVCRAPEVMEWETAQYSTASDVYSIGYCLREMCYANIPFTPFAEYPVPEPFDKVFEACTQFKVEDRPTMQELRDMVSQIQIQ
jgi:serine/threonine protein kinase